MVRAMVVTISRHSVGAQHAQQDAFGDQETGALAARYADDAGLVRKHRGERFAMKRDDLRDRADSEMALDHFPTLRSASSMAPDVKS